MSAMTNGRVRLGGPAAAVERPPSEPRSYHGQPVIKEPIWTPEIPWYFFTGGLGGASAGLAWLSGLRGNEVLARRAWLAALVGTGVSPVLLISDLGRPLRFLNMLRMFKVTSPMSVGSWVLVASGGSVGVAALDAQLPDLERGRRGGRVLSAPGARPSAFGGPVVHPHRHPPDRRARLSRSLVRPRSLPRSRAVLRALARPARPAAALAGLPLATYTGALIAQTAVPVWHEARRELPALFAAGAAASAGAAATVLTPVSHAGPARRLALVGAAAELTVIPLMEHRLGELGEPYHVEAAGTYAQLARGLTVAGSLLLAARAARSRPAAVVGGVLVLAGAVCERWSVFKAGFQSARDPRYTVGPQRRRVAGGRTRGASRRVVAAAPAPAAVARASRSGGLSGADGGGCPHVDRPGCAGPVRRGARDDRRRAARRGDRLAGVARDLARRRPVGGRARAGRRGAADRAADPRGAGERRGARGAARARR